MDVVRWLESRWQEKGFINFLLFPLALLYDGLAHLRRGWYRIRNRARPHLPVPAVIVVGNITTGGTGKTPLVIWLCQYLREHGFWPGVVSRGYGGSRSTGPMEVTVRSDPAETGDEPLLIAQRTHCPVFVDTDRRRAAETLLVRYRCDVIVSDDGLQHYNLERDIEIAVVDGVRRFGNGFCLPAGPLRESVGRLSEVDFVVVNGKPHTGESAMRVDVAWAINLADPSQVRRLETFRNEHRVHAVAGIGHPQRYFDRLTKMDIRFEPHPFPDHHPFVPADLDFGDAGPVLMTEKDAVKCRNFARPHHWFLPVSAVPDREFAAALLASVRALKQMYSLR